MTVDVWQECTIGDLTSMGSGGTPPSKVSRYYGGGIPWVSIADMTASTKYVRNTTKTLSTEGLAESAAKLYEPDAVLYAMYASLGECAIAVGRVSSSQAILGIQPGPNLDREYLYYYLESIKGKIKTIGQQGAQSNLNAGMVRALRIGLPSIDEQKRISTVLRDTDDLIATLEHLITKKQAIKQGMMQQLLTGRTRLPGFTDEWSLTTLGNLGAFFKGKGVKRDDVRTTGTPCIRYGELYTDFIDYTALTRSFVSRDVANTALPIRSGDLLFAGSGETRAEIGVCVAYVGNSPAVAGGDIVVLRGDAFNPVYLATLVNSPVVADQKARAGQGDAVVHISSRALAAIVVSLPSRPEQDAIADALIDSDREIATLRGRLQKSRAIKTGMMQQLLTGRTRLHAVEGVA